MSPAIMRRSDLPNSQATQFKPRVCGNSSGRGAHRREMRPGRIPHHRRVDESSGPDSLRSQSNARTGLITVAPITASDGPLRDLYPRGRRWDCPTTPSRTRLSMPWAPGPRRGRARAGVWRGRSPWRARVVDEPMPGIHSSSSACVRAFRLALAGTGPVKRALFRPGRLGTAS